MEVEDVGNDIGIGGLASGNKFLLIEDCIDAGGVLTETGTLLDVGHD